MDTTTALPLCIVCFLVIYLYRRAAQFAARSRGLPLPPGPSPLPIIGNILDIPKVSACARYRDMCKDHGDIISLQALGQYIIVVNDANLAIDLLDKHSTIYSSRPCSPIIATIGSGWHLALMPYGQLWRRHRRVFWHHLQPSVMSEYASLQEDGARYLLSRLFDSPDTLGTNVRHCIGASIIRVAYGLDATGGNDKYITAFEDGISGAELLLAGPSLLDIFPMLANVPPWLPGAGLQRRMAHYQQATTKLLKMPWFDAKEAIKSGKASASIASSMIEAFSHLDDTTVEAEEETSRNAVASAYVAGIDTLHVTLVGFFLAMSLYPEVQRKAQAELDAVVGPNRLPQLTDRDALPYVNAIAKESLRWHVAVPLGLPHTSTADGEYNGYFIPEKSIVFVNIWSILHDPGTYPEPEEFRPERYLQDGKINAEVRDPASIAFGFGRRICPGRAFADTSLFIYIASILHTSDITPPLDGDGKPIRIDLRPSFGIVSHIEDPRCTIKPRSASAEQLIRGASEYVSV